MNVNNARQNDDRSLSDEAFRKVVRSWIAENYPLAVRNPPHRLPFAEVKPWYMALSRRGWLAPGWPVELFELIGLSASFGLTNTEFSL